MGDRETVRRGYDELAETYAARSESDARNRAILDEFLDTLSNRECILDAGCGRGVPVLQRLHGETAAIGLDFSRAQLRLASEVIPEIPLLQGDMKSLPFRDDVFDAVTAFDSIIHVLVPDHQTVLDEFARVLRPGGRLLLSEAPEEFERTNANWLDSGVEMTWHMAGAAATRNQLHDAGFEITDEWDSPETTSENGPSPPFFAARLEE